jgi:hypothetical protein
MRDRVVAGAAKVAIAASTARAQSTGRSLASIRASRNTSSEFNAALGVPAHGFSRVRHEE